MEEFFLEYLEKGELSVHGVGTFGAMRIDREAMAKYHKAASEAQIKKKEAPRIPDLIRITRLPVSCAIAKQFIKDKRFQVHGLVPLALAVSEISPQKKDKRKAAGAKPKKQKVKDKEVNDAR